MVFLHKNRKFMMSSDYFDMYFTSAVKQARGLTTELKALDSSYHSNINPISIFGELPVNSQQNHHLVELFITKFDEEIKVTCIDDDSYVKAFVQLKTKNNTNTREIYLTKNNTCWSRFYLCKELSQSLIYTEENSTANLEDMQALFSHLLNKIVDKKNPQISADYVAYLVAMEFLLPTAIIPKLLKAKDNGNSNLQIAKKMLTPEKIVDFRLSTVGQELFAID